MIPNVILLNDFNTMPQNRAYQNGASNMQSYDASSTSEQTSTGPTTDATSSVKKHEKLHFINAIICKEMLNLI